MVYKKSLIMVSQNSTLQIDPIDNTFLSGWLMVKLHYVVNEINNAVNDFINNIMMGVNASFHST